MTAIELRNVEKYYGQGIARVHVLSDVNFKAELGKLNLVIGPSGSGKSIFLTIAGGLQQPSEGQVLIDGQESSALTGKQRDRLRLDKIGFVLQSYNLLPYLTVGDQFALVDRMRHGNLSKGELGDLLKDLGIEKLIHKYPGELSGGQNQRVTIARALYTDPQIILADEPTAALDSDRVKVVGQLFSDLAVKHNKAVVVVTHDLRLREFADQVYTIVDGQMAKEERPLGTPA